MENFNPLEANLNFKPLAEYTDEEIEHKLSQTEVTNVWGITDLISEALKRDIKIRTYNVGSSYYDLQNPLKNDCDNKIDFVGKSTPFGDNMFFQKKFLLKKRVFKNKRMNFSKGRLKRILHCFVLGTSGSGKSVYCGFNGVPKFD